MKKLIGFIFVMFLSSGCTVVINNPPLELYEVTDAERTALSDVIDGEGV